MSDSFSGAPIVVVGNVNLDIKTGLIPASEAILSDGETSVEEVYESIGGGGANVAVAAAAMGGIVHFCGAVGDDALGRRLTRSLRGLGIAPHLQRVPAPTGRSINLNWNNRHRHFVSCLPASALLNADPIPLRALAKAGCRHLYRADVWFGSAMLEGGDLELLRNARELGMETSLDINWDPEWSVDPGGERVRERIGLLKAVLPYVSYAHGNEREIAFFAGRSDAWDAARALIDGGVGTAILHRGDRGSAALTSAGERIEAPAEPVSDPVCETGTGDVFTAAFLLRSDLPLRDRLEACNRVAASHLRGAPNYIPRLSD